MAAADDPDFDEEDEELLGNIGEHSLLSRVQRRLWDQLQRKKARIELELREVAEDADRSRKSREDLGVELYGLQQQLARLQLQLEAAHNNSNLLADIRKKSEADLKRFREVFKERKEQLDAEERKLDHAKAEVEGINETIRQMEAYDAQMKSDIAVTRRETYGVEEAISKAEKAKVAQDLYIDRMSEDFKAKSEELTLYEARLAAQRAEARAASSTLAEAVKEMEIIQGEKKQLLMQWQSTLVAIQKRDEALQATHSAVRKQKEEEEAMQADELGFKKDTQKAQADNAVLQERLDKQESEAAFLVTQLQAMKRQRDALAERYSMLQKSLAQTDAEGKRLREEQDLLRVQVAQLEQDRQTVDRQRQELEEGYAANISTQSTVQKAAKNLVKERKKVMEKIHAKEAEKAAVENELARLKIDTMNVEAHNMQLKQTLEACERDLRDKGQQIERATLEIRQRNDSIEKKMSIVDRLNRRYEKLTAGVEEENMGPLEATIRNLSKQIAAKVESSERLQQEWLRDQTTMVAVANVVEEQVEKIHDMNSQYTLATQKQMRLDSAFAQQRTEIKQLQVGIETMHKDMVRLNTLIAKNEELSKRLAESSFNLEKDFVAELKSMEEVSVSLESQVATLKEDKAKLLEDILEAERQVLMWEKKIALERETQAALDPTVGMAEAAEMEKEIHRMRLRYESLQRTQEKLVKEMELAIDKRESISLRFHSKRVMESESDSAAPLTQIGLKKQMATLKKALSAATVDTQGYEEAIELKRKELSSLETDVQERSTELSGLESEAAALQHSINSTQYDRQRGLERLASIQRMAARYDSVNRGRRPPMTEEEADSVWDRHQAAEREHEAVRALIAGLAEAHPGLAEVLVRVSQLLDT